MRFAYIVPIMGGKAAKVDFAGVGLNSIDTLIHLPHFPAFDSKVQVRSSEILPGGQVATAAVACRRWGLQCRYIGKIGDDQAGKVQRDSLETEGIETHLIEAPGCSSQQAFILVDESTGERTILWQRDPRLDLRPEELRREWITEAKLLHVDGHPSEPAATAARWAREAGVIVTSDLDNLYGNVEELLHFVDFAIGSIDFPARLTGNSDLFQSLPEITERFGCRVSGATLGSEGVLAWDGSNFLYCPAFRVKVVDTTGAGDLFHAGFAYALLQEWELARALEFSCAAAGLNCTAHGARGGIRSLEEIALLVRDGERLPAAYPMNLLQERSRAHRKSSHPANTA